MQRCPQSIDATTGFEDVDDAPTVHGIRDPVTANPGEQQAEGLWNQISGRVKEAWGALSDDALWNTDDA